MTAQKEGKSIAFQFSEKDKEMLDALKNNFKDYELFKSKGFDGMEIMFVAVIPTAALTLQLLDFIFTHIKNKENDTDRDRKDRSVLCDGKRIMSEELKGSKKDVAKKISVTFIVEIAFDIDSRDFN